MLCQQINSKKEYYALARRHLLGNTVSQWTWGEFTELLRQGAKIPSRVALRGMTPASKAIQKYDLTTKMAYRRGLRSKVSHDEILVDEQAPDDFSTLKGEVMRDTNYLYMRYDMTPGLRMRAAYAWDGPPGSVIPPRPRGMAHASGLQAQGLLKRHMDYASWEMLMELFDRFPESIVEFSCYSKRLGKFGLNSVFWEVRNY